MPPPDPPDPKFSATFLAYLDGLTLPDFAEFLEGHLRVLARIESDLAAQRRLLKMARARYAVVLKRDTPSGVYSYGRVTYRAHDDFKGVERIEYVPR